MSLWRERRPRGRPERDGLGGSDRVPHLRDHPHGWYAACRLLHEFRGRSTDGRAVNISVPIGNELTDAGSLRFTMKQTLGTARAVPWKALKVG